ncbi:MAG: hypothetical protein IT448_05410 [Phycisphaerales bacterium]|nr:hypothetical protein [Phycisphaerales bacterium]
MTATGLKSRSARFARRALLPGIVFAAVLLIHFAYLAVFPERDAVQERWLAVDAQPTLLQRYIQSRGYWLGYSYGLSLAFTAVALRRYREHRFCAARNLAIGGITLSGFLAVVGCFLLGCCGSPMLGVYLSLFGTAFVPLAKPLVAGVNTLLIVGSYWWLCRQERRIGREASTPPGCGDAPVCHCPPSGGSLDAPRAALDTPVARAPAETTTS